MGCIFAHDFSCPQSSYNACTERDVCRDAFLDGRVMARQPSAKGGPFGKAHGGQSASRDKTARVESDISEKDFQASVIAAAELYGWMSYHTHDSRRSEPGFVDLVLVHPGRRLVKFRELKTYTGRITLDQKKWLNALEAAGADVGVWRPAELDSIIDELSVGHV